MTEQRFDLFIEQNNSTKSTESLVRDVLALLGDNSPRLEFKLSEALLFNNGMTAIYDNITAEEAECLVKRFATLDVMCGLRPTLDLVSKEEEAKPEGISNLSPNDIYTCPACAHQQPKVKEEENRLDACEVCGIVGARYKHKSSQPRPKPSSADADKMRPDIERAQRIREVLERAKQEEAAILQAEAKHFATHHAKHEAKKPPLLLIASVVAFLVMLGWYFWQAQQTTAETAANTSSHLISIKKATKLAGNPPQAPPAAPWADANTIKTYQTVLTNALQRDIQATNSNDGQTQQAQQISQAQTILIEMERKAVLPTRFAFAQSVHMENRRRLLQFLRLGDLKLSDTILSKVSDVYPRTLLQLDIATWQISRQQRGARSTLQNMETNLAQLQDPQQQALIHQALARAYGLQHDWQIAAQHLNNAISQAASLPKPLERFNLLIRLANESTLLGQPSVAKQLLSDIHNQIKTLPAQATELRAAVLAYLAEGYALQGNFETANQIAQTISNPTTQQTLVELLQQTQLAQSQSPVQTAAQP